MSQMGSKFGERFANSRLVVCPRCKRERPSEWYPRPVRICIVCYSRIPENEGMSLAALFAKAKRSKIARYRGSEQAIEQREYELAENISTLLDIESKQPTAADILNTAAGVRECPNKNCLLDILDPTETTCPSCGTALDSKRGRYQQFTPPVEQPIDESTQPSALDILNIATGNKKKEEPE